MLFSKKLKREFDHIIQLSRCVLVPRATIGYLVYKLCTTMNDLKMVKSLPTSEMVGNIETLK